MKTIKHTYSYDAYGNLLSEYKRGNGQGQAKEDWAYQYDELNRLVQAHEDHGNQTRNYQYDSLGNLTCEWNSNNVVVDYKLNNLNQITTKSDDKWKTHTDYSYDKRGNNTKKVYYKNKKQTVMGSYVFDESNRMVIGTNDAGEQSIYHFNGLGVLVTNEWITAKNNYGYHDVVPNVEPPEVIIGSSGNNNSNGKGNNGKGNGNNGAGNTNSSGKWSHVIKDFVIDYNSDAEENLMEYERYDEGLTYRYVYGVDKLGVTAYTIANGSASVTTDAGEIPLYYHMDHMGSSEFLTSDVTQRVTSWTSYDEWGNITHNAVLKCGTRELDLVKTYTGHERDSVLGMYYAKARMYDTADKHGSSKGNKLGDKRFTAVDPVKGNVRNPQSLVQYTYVLNNPLMYVDPLGRETFSVGINGDLAFIGRISGGVDIMFDLEGNVAVVVISDVGAGTPNLSFGVHGTGTNAETIDGALGWGNNVGASVWIFDVDTLVAKDSVTGKDVRGLTLGLSGGTEWALPEVHGGGSVTEDTILRVNVFELKEKIENSLKKIEKYMDQFACEILQGV